MFMISAQFDNPPDFFFENMCNAIDGAPEGTSILVRTAAGLNASIFGNQSCHDVYQFKKGKLAWPWQDKNLHSEILQATSSSPMDFGIHTLLEVKDHDFRISFTDVNFLL